MSVPDARVRLAVRGHLAQWLLLAGWAIPMGLTYPHANFWPLAHVALAPLALLAIRGEPVRRVAGYTYLAGLAWWLVMIRWLAPVTGPGYVALCAYLALYPLAFVLLLRLWQAAMRPPFVLAVPIAWVATEYVRGLLLSGFPWFLLGHSQPAVMIQIADTVGAYGVSFLAAMFSGLLLDLVTRPLVRPAGAGRTVWGTPMKLSLPLWAIALAITLGYGAWRLHTTPTDTPTLRVAVVQTDVPQSNKMSPKPAQQRENFRSMMQLAERAAERRPELIVMPETMVPWPINDESVRMFEKLGLPHGRYRTELKTFAGSTGVPLLVGAHAKIGWEPVDPDARRPRYRPERRYNAAYLIGPERGIIQRYEKVHRVPFGEYLPGLESWPWAKRMLLKLAPEAYQGGYTLNAGSEWTRFTLPGTDWRFTTPICFEDVVSYAPRRMVYGAGERKRADLLVNLTNDGWFAGSAEGPQHEQIARFRCVENRVPMARSVNTGVSSLIDSAGRVVERVEQDGRTQRVAGVAVAELHRDPRRTLFGRLGDLPAAAALAIAIGLTLTAAARNLSTQRS